MSIIRSTIADLAKMLKVHHDQAEDVLLSDTSAKRALKISRRGFFIGAGAVGAGVCVSVPSLADDCCWQPGLVMDAAREIVAKEWARQMALGERLKAEVAYMNYEDLREKLRGLAAAVVVLPPGFEVEFIAPNYLVSRAKVSI